MNERSTAVISRIVDSAIEVPVVTSFTRLGYAIRSRLEHWRPLAEYDLTGRAMLITGATSGLGLAAAETLAGCGAELILLGRDAAKTERVREQIERRTGNTKLSTAIADMGDMAAVRRVATQILAEHPALHVIIHNAGALSDKRSVNADGIETTIASQVVGPFLLTTLVLPALQAAGSGRVITMSSGGMYATGLTISRLEMGDDYKGSEQYARAKRAQVTLNEMWAERFPHRDVVFHALHPGWADTPGVESSLPKFHKLVGPLLRTPHQGADTAVWLAADDGLPLSTTGKFWLDRRQRSIHKLPSTRKTDTPQRRAELWQWCLDTASVADPTPSEVTNDCSD